MLTVVEHSSPLYAPRTYLNAKLADLTVAIAIDFNTAGERLTHRAAGDRYVWIALSSDLNQAAEKLSQALREFSVRTLNVAGNGLYSLAARGWTQDRLNVYVHGVLRAATTNWPIRKVISGGQTGSDLAGMIAAYALDIDAEATLPKGFIQRGPDKRDRQHSREDIVAQIEHGATQLRNTMADLEQVAGPFESLIPNSALRKHIFNATEERSGQDTAPRTPRLYNLKRDRGIPPDAVYIGRGTWRGQKSKLGNVFEIGRDGTRDEVCDKFEEWATARPEIMVEIELLRGQDLVCHCSPYRCHGHWILKMANREIAPVANTTRPTVTTAASFVQFDPQI